MSFSLSALGAACPGAISQGILWGIMALGVFVTYKILDYADLTVDGSICTGGAVSAILISNGMNPGLTLIFSVIAGMIAGAITGFLHTRLKIPAILSGILTQLALYSINIRIMGKANLSLLNKATVISLGNVQTAIIIGIVIAVIVIALLYWFFGTEIGCSIRSTGDNPNMVRALGVNTNTAKLLGLIISNGIVAFAGGLLAQYQGYADINMGRGAIVIGLASVIIGEVLFSSKFNFALRLGSIICGAIIYYLVIAVVLQLGLSTTDLKLFSAIVVAVALALPTIKGSILSNRSKPSPKPKGVNPDA